MTEKGLSVIGEQGGVGAMRSIGLCIIVVLCGFGAAFGQPGQEELSQEHLNALCVQLRNNDPFVRQRAAMEASVVFEQLRPLVDALASTIAEQSFPAAFYALPAADAVERLGNLPANAIRSGAGTVDPTKELPAGVLVLRRYLPDARPVVTKLREGSQWDPYSRRQLEMLVNEIEHAGGPEPRSPLTALIAQKDALGAEMAFLNDLPPGDYVSDLASLVEVLDAADAHLDIRFYSTLLIGRAGPAARPFQHRLEKVLKSAREEEFSLRAALAVSLLRIVENPRDYVDTCCRVFSDDNWHNRTSRFVVAMIGERLFDEQTAVLLKRPLVSRSEDLRLGAVRLAGTGGPRARALTDNVIRLLQDDTEEIRYSALKALPMIARQQDTVRVFAELVKDSRFSSEQDWLHLWLNAFAQSASSQPAS